MRKNVVEQFDLSGDIAVSVREMNLYYGSFHALKSVYRSVGLRKINALKIT